MGGLPRFKARADRDPAAFVLEDLRHSMARSGRIIVEFEGGTIEVSTNGTAWCDGLDDEALADFADRLATVAEDPQILLAATGSGELRTLPEPRRGLRTFIVKR